MARITKSAQKLKEKRYEGMMETFKEVAEKHNLKEEIVIDVFKKAVRNVYARQRGGDDVHVEVVINEEMLDFEARLLKVVVARDEDIEDDALEISLEEAHAFDAMAEVGDNVVVERGFLSNFSTKTSSNVAQNFRHQLIELEKEQLFNLFKDKIGELVKGTVEKNEKTTYINLLGITNVFFDERGKQAIPGEILRNGQELNFYIVDVVSGAKGASIVISRSHPNFVKRLMEREVHEIYDGTIVIHDIVREEGERVKVAVESLDPNVDPVGSCIGPNASRIQKITAELGPDGRKEKIDIIPWSKNPAIYIFEAFRPAVPLGIKIDTEEKNAKVIFAEDEKGKAFGHRGANIRLAAKLTGYNISIFDVHEAMEQGLTFQTKADIEYEERLAEQERTRERLLKEIARSEEVAQRVAEQKQLLEDEVNAMSEEDTLVYKDDYVETAEESVEPVITPKAPEPVVQQVKTTISLADLEAELAKEKEKEEAKEKAQAKREERKRKPEVKPQPEVVEPTVSGPKMDIYTEEELRELEEQNQEVFEEDDIDYEDFDEYYE
ncbi:MAG: transcription termination factor NusA [Bacilli bacterium]|nr:transcription termination factor NusA [Bacilli bacterium]